MALMTPNHQTVPVVRHGTLVYLTPTVIPYNRYTGPRTELENCSLMHEFDLTPLDSELRGVSDAQDCQTTWQRLPTSLQHPQANIKISGMSMRRMEDW